MPAVNVSWEEALSGAYRNPLRPVVTRPEIRTRNQVADDRKLITDISHNHIIDWIASQTYVIVPPIADLTTDGTEPTFKFMLEMHDKYWELKYEHPHLRIREMVTDFSHYARAVLHRRKCMRDTYASMIHEADPDHPDVDHLLRMIKQQGVTSRRARDHIIRLREER
jgi:hypothetical protein